MATSVMKKGDKSKTPMTDVDFPQMVENQNRADLITPAPLSAMTNTIDIVDPRKINAVTGKPLNPNIDLVGGKYPKDRVVNIVKAAKRYGINPYDLLAVDLQESRLGIGQGEGGSNVFGNIGLVGHNNMPMSALKVPSKLSEQGSKDDQFDQFARAYATKMKDADRLNITDPATRLQVYNGLGVLKNTYGKKMYGIDVPNEGINMKENPLYGKRVLDFRDNVLAKNPELALYVQHINP